MSRLPRSCSCGRIVPSGKTCPCKQRDRGTTTERGYGTRWQKISARVIAEEFMCRDCGHLGSVENPLTCDHIVSKARGGTDDRANLCCRCRVHNSAKGARVGPGGVVVSANIITRPQQGNDILMA